jgi:hypothetical protein
MLIAVTSKTGTEVDQHFGHAEKCDRNGSPFADCHLLDRGHRS